MIQAYVRALRRRGIPREHWILPAITYVRKLSEGRFEYRTIVPYMQPFPSEAGFTLAEKIPDRFFQLGLKNGLMPMANFHDITASFG